MNTNKSTIYTYSTKPTAGSRLFKRAINDIITDTQKHLLKPTIAKQQRTTTPPTAVKSRKHRTVPQHLLPNPSRQTSTKLRLHNTTPVDPDTYRRSRAQAHTAQLIRELEYELGEYFIREEQLEQQRDYINPVTSEIKESFRKTAEWIRKNVV